MSTVESPVTIVINRLALGPTAPDAGSPLLTRVAEVVAQMGPRPGRSGSSRTSGIW